MNKTIGLLLVLLFVPQLTDAQMRATTEDGRSVLLKPDKTWDFVAAEPKPAVEEADSATSRNRNWFYMKSADPLTDKDTSMVGTAAKESENGGLAVRCKGDEVEIIVRVGADLGPSRTGQSRVIYRFMGEKNAKPIETQWPQSTDRQVLFVAHDQIGEFLKNVSKYKGLVIRVFDAAGTPHTLEFSLEGDDGFLKRLSCLK
ncbi:MAG: hypothetical protein ACNA8W_17820 [Bradymonadaceae bacterium]